MWYFSLFLGVFAIIVLRNFRVSLYLILMFIPVYLLRFKITGIPTNLLEVMIGITFLVWLFAHAKHSIASTLKSFLPYIFPITLIFIGLGIGLLVSSDKAISLGIIKGWFVVPLVLTIMMVASFKSLVHIKKAILSLLISATILSCFAIYQVITKQYLTVDQRASSVFVSANYLSLYLVPILILSLGLWSSLKSWIWKVAMSIGWLICVTALYFTFSYAGWLALISGIGVLILLMMPLWLATITTLTFGGIAIISQLQYPKFQQMLDLTGRSSSHVRLEVWQTDWLMIKENWFTGIGTGLFSRRYLSFASRLFSPPLELNMLHAHNIFIQFWLDTGLIGLIGFVWLLVNFFITMFKKLFNTHSVMGRAMIAAMVGLLIHGLFDTAYWKNDLSILFWTIIALGTVLIAIQPITHERS